MQKLKDSIPINIQIKVCIKFAFINLITELGYRENKTWSSDEDENLAKICKYAEDCTKSIEKYIKKSKKE